MPKRTRQRRSESQDAALFYDALRDLLKLTAERDPRVVCAWGVTITECHAIEHLAKTDGASLNGLATHLHLDKSTTSRAVDALVRKRLVRREAHPEDRRAVRLHLTKKGEDVAGAVGKANRESYARILRDLPASERARLVEAMRRIASLVTGLEPEPTP